MNLFRKEHNTTNTQPRNAFRCSRASLRLQNDIEELTYSKFQVEGVKTTVKPPTRDTREKSVGESTKCLTCTITPLRGVYAHASYEFRFVVSENYPFAPPTVRCMTKIFHPNIDFRTGRVSTKILENNGWNAVFSLNSVIKELQILLTDPNYDLKHAICKNASDLLHENYEHFCHAVQRTLKGGWFFGHEWNANPVRESEEKRCGGDVLCVKRAREECYHGRGSKRTAEMALQVVEASGFVSSHKKLRTNSLFSVFKPFFELPRIESPPSPSPFSFWHGTDTAMHDERKIPENCNDSTFSASNDLRSCVTKEERFLKKSKLDMGDTDMSEVVELVSQQERRDVQSLIRTVPSRLPMLNSSKSTRTTLPKFSASDLEEDVQMSSLDVVVKPLSFVNNACDVTFSSYSGSTDS